ncbi:MAG: hypothetical protein ASARMPREDX12_007284 [Alectoria sarmentosa]|nr:MAG: hypothetical protein ASARMPREDX12_007284 [Alectoria sarmentosa]
MHPNMSRLTSRAPAPTIRGILLQCALGCAKTTKPDYNLGSGVQPCPASILTTIGSASTSTTPTTTAALSATSSVLSFSRPSAILPVSVTISDVSAVASATSSPTTRPRSNHIAVGAGIGIGVPVGLAILASIVYFILRRLKTDNKKELDANGKVVHGAFELERGNRTTELSGQSLAELEHPPI